MRNQLIAFSVLILIAATGITGTIYFGIRAADTVELERKLSRISEQFTEQRESYWESLVIINETMNSSQSTIQSLSDTLVSYKVILQRSESNTDSLESTTTVSAKTSDDLNEIIESLTPSFWESQLGQGIRLVGIIAGSFGAGYIVASVF